MRTPIDGYDARTMSNQPLQPGPYDNTRVTTFEISNVKVTITTADKSSHVPPHCSCGGGGGAGSLEQLLMGFIQAMRQAQAANAASSETPEPDEEPAAPAPSPAG